MKKLIVLMLMFAALAAACQQADNRSSEPPENSIAPPVGSAAPADSAQQTPLADYLKPLTAEVVADIAWYLDSSYLDYDAVQADAAAELRLADLAGRIERLSLGQQYIALYRAFGQFNDAHTYFSIDQLNDASLPIIFERIDQAFIIINSTPKQRHLIGQQIVKIDGLAIDDWYRRAYAMVAADNDYGRSRAAIDLLHRPLVYALYNEGVKDSLSFETGELTSQLSFAKNRRTKQFLNNEHNYLRLGSSTNQLFKIAKKDGYGYWLDDETKIITVYFNRLDDAKSSRLVKFGKLLQDVIAARPNYAVVFDFRNCLGGNTAALSTIFSGDFLAQISARSFSYVSRNSMSVGTLAPDQLRQSFGIKVIGEPTPYSVQTAFISTSADKYRIAAIDGLVSSSFSNGGYRARLAEPALVPDYLIEPQFDDYVGRRDIWQAKLIDIIEQ